MKQITEQEINSARSPRGGWNRKTLESWGVPWPPPKGWKAKLLNGKKKDKPIRKSVFDFRDELLGDEQWIAEQIKRHNIDRTEITRVLERVATYIDKNKHPNQNGLKDWLVKTFHYNFKRTSPNSRSMRFELTASATTINAFISACQDQGIDPQLMLIECMEKFTEQVNRVYNEKA